MRAPEFWRHDGLWPRLLSPFARLFDDVGVRRRRAARPVRVDVPVICVGNLVAGGAGKTPVVLSLVRHLVAAGHRPAVVTRGHGGRAAGPLAVDLQRHDAAMVGDEALLLARLAPTIVARDRVAGARHAIANGADLIVLDDGFQNPGLAKDFSILVVDGGYGFGNGRVMPAGPLRETISSGLARADAVVIVGDDRVGVGAGLDAEARRGLARPILRARLVPVGGEDLAGRDVFAFAGIGRPEKFFETLEGLGARLVGRCAFDDHHPYRPSDLADLQRAAGPLGALLVTTAKDRVRLPATPSIPVRVLEVELSWQDEAAIAGLLARAVLSRGVS